MGASKEIKSRIRSVKNTGKITKAMELISTVKMKKAQENVLGLRPFAHAALQILQRISDDKDIFVKYTVPPETANKELIFIISSQKWLCGGYNVNIFKKTLEYLRDETTGDFNANHDFITVWKKARDFVLRTGLTLVADFSELIPDPAMTLDSRQISRFLMDSWNSGNYSKISIVYSHYVSAINQTPIVKTLFPFDENAILDFLYTISGDTSCPIVHDTAENDFTIEPNPEVILDYAIPMIMDAIVHETILEARASEHAARMVAMKNAKDAAKKKASILTLAYNKARQWAITTEISEIVSGVESMKE